jgi:hypothetical protein
MDWAGPFGWHDVEGGTLRFVADKLANFETMTWAEIEGRENHQVPCGNLCREARRRLEELEQDDLEELFSLRLTSANRVWGIKDRYILRLLWWDPNHAVCPSAAYRP